MRRSPTFVLVTLLFVPIYFITLLISMTGIRHGPESGGTWFIACFVIGLLIYGKRVYFNSKFDGTASSAFLLAVGIVIGGAIIGSISQVVLTSYDSVVFQERREGTTITALEDRPYLSPAGRPVGIALKLSVTSKVSHRFCPGIWLEVVSTGSASAPAGLRGQYNGEMDYKFPKSDKTPLSHCLELKRGEAKEFTIQMIPPFYHAARGCILMGSYNKGPQGAFAYSIGDTDKQIPTSYVTKHKYNWRTFLENMEYEGIKRCED